MNVAIEAVAALMSACSFVRLNFARSSVRTFSEAAFAFEADMLGVVDEAVAAGIVKRRGWCFEGEFFFIGLGVAVGHSYLS
jgi:hypothetical protein